MSKIGEGLHENKIERINKKIAALGNQRRKLRKEALRLTNKRERLLGQGLTG